MARKVILDVDPGIDDAVALCLALFDPRLEVVAVTATGGNVPPEQSTLNVQAIVEQLDPPRLPRIGAASRDVDLPVNAREVHGPSGLGDALFNVAELHHQHPSDKVICDEIRAAPGEVTIITLGPLTNIAAALGRDPELATMIGHLIVMGGSCFAPGNVTPAAEFNIYSNPIAAQTVFRSGITKTLVPLDITSQLVMTYDQSDQLPGESTKKGALLRQILPFAFRSHRQLWGMEGIHLHDAVAVIAAIHPELFETEEMAGDVETAGELTLGATIFDRRMNRASQSNMEVVTSLDVAAVMDCIMRGLAARE